MPSETAIMRSELKKQNGIDGKASKATKLQIYRTLKAQPGSQYESVKCDDVCF